MLSKFKVLITFIFLGGLLLSGCVDEPDMEIPNRPFTQVRVANFITNAAVINVSIDNTLDNTSNHVSMSSFTDLNGNSVSNNLSTGQFTSYFDLQSGDRPFTILNDAGTVVFDEEVPLGSYEEVLILFVGNYDPNIDNTTVAANPVWIGRTYLDDNHQTTDPNGEAKVYVQSDEGVAKFVNAAQSVITDGFVDEAKAYSMVNVLNTATGNGLTITNEDEEILPGIENNYVGAILEEGTYFVEFVELSDSSTVVSTLSGTYDIAAGKTTLFIVHGEPSNASILKYEEDFITTTRPR